MPFDRMIRSPRFGRDMARIGLVGLVALAAACVKPEPRRFEEFMDDSIAREGTLARCNSDREGTAHDIECANARRAAAAIALREEQERRAALERESERKLAELRAQIERRDRAKREAMAAALAAAEAAYEAQWADEALAPGESPPDFEPVQPPMAETVGLDDEATNAALGALPIPSARRAATAFD